jgi:hypothetical protein
MFLAYLRSPFPFAQLNMGRIKLLEGTWFVWTDVHTEDFSLADEWMSPVIIRLRSVLWVFRTCHLVNLEHLCLSYELVQSK